MDIAVEYDPMITTMVCTSAHRNGTHVDMLKYPTLYTAASTKPMIDAPMVPKRAPKKTNVSGMSAARSTLLLEKTMNAQVPVRRKVIP